MSEREQAIYLALVEEKNKAGDTNIKILLLYYLDRGLNIPMVMQSPKRCRADVDITVKVKKYATIIPDMLSAYALTGCDTSRLPRYRRGEKVKNSSVTEIQLKLPWQYDC